MTSHSCLDAIRLKPVQLTVSSFKDAQRDMRVAFWRLGRVGGTHRRNRDQADCHTTDKLDLLPRSPELNPVENAWQYMRENWLSNLVFSSPDRILPTCCEAWTKLTQESGTSMSIGTRNRVNEF